MYQTNRKIVSDSGFSLIELLAAVALIGVLASTGFVAFVGLRESAEREKMESDVKTLNASVMNYLGNGGSLDSATLPSEVLTKLKSTTSSSQADRMPGFSSSSLDERIDFIVQSSTEALTDEPRAVWNTLKQRFEVKTSGTAGIKSFILRNDAAAPLATTTPTETGSEETRSAPMLYSGASNWIWDYQDPASGNNYLTPTAVTLADESAFASPDPLPVSLPSSSSPAPTTSTSPLAAPGFSVPGGSFPISNYNLAVALSDPNLAGTSTLVYSVDYGNWIAYIGNPITIAPDQVLRTQAIPLTADYTGSTVTEATYTATPEALIPPAITHDGPFSDPQVNPVTVTISHSNEPAVSGIAYQIDGGGWLAYSSPFTLNASDHPAGAQITAMVAPTASYYVQSSEVTSNIPVDVAAPGPSIEMTTGIEAGSWSIGGAAATYTFTDSGTSIVLTQAGTSWSTGSINSWGAWSQPVDGTGSVRAIFDAGDSFTLQVFDASNQPISPDSIELHLDRLGGSSGAGIFTLQSGSWAGTSGNSGFASTSTTVKTSLGGTNQSGGSVKLNESVSSMAIANGGATDMIALQVTIAVAP